MEEFIKFLNKNLDAFLKNKHVEQHWRKYITSGVSLLAVYLIRKFANGPVSPLSPDLKGKVIIVTGSSDGLGLVAAKELLSKGAVVIFACRNKSKTENAINNLPENLRERAVFIELDLSSFESIKRFVDEFKSKFERLDILINNAAVANADFQKTKDGIESILQTNTFSPMVLTDMLIDILKKSKGRVINLSSMAYDFYKPTPNEFKVDPKVYDFNEKTFNFMNQYSLSKLGNIYFTKHLKKISNEKGYGIKSCSLHPGGIETSLQRDLKGFAWFVWKIMLPFKWLLFKTPFHGAQTTLHCAYLDEKDLEDGEYYSDIKVKKLSLHGTQDELVNSFIELSRGIIALYGEKYGIKLNHI